MRHQLGGDERPGQRSRWGLIAGQWVPLAGEAPRCLQSVTGCAAGRSARRARGRQPPDGGNGLLLARPGTWREEFVGGGPDATLRPTRFSRPSQHAPPRVVAVPRQDDLMFGPLGRLPVEFSGCSRLRGLEDSQVVPTRYAGLGPTAAENPQSHAVTQGPWATRRTIEMHRGLARTWQNPSIPMQQGCAGRALFLK